MRKLVALTVGIVIGAERVLFKAKSRFEEILSPVDWKTSKIAASMASSHAASFGSTIIDQLYAADAGPRTDPAPVSKR